MPPYLTKDRYESVLDWADWHFGVISREELGELGVPAGTIAAWIANGRLQRLHQGVYAVGHSALRREGHWRAAALTCGPHAALSHHTGMLALGHWVPEHTGLHLTTPRAGRSRDALQVHRSPLAAVDVTLRHGLRVTRLERALIDLADLLPWLELAAIADRLGDLDVARSPTRGRSSSGSSCGSCGATGCRGPLVSIGASTCRGRLPHPALGGPLRRAGGSEDRPADEAPPRAWRLMEA